MKILKYGRFWAVYAGDGALICVCVYKKGAREVLRRLQGTQASMCPVGMPLSR